MKVSFIEQMLGKIVREVLIKYDIIEVHESVSYKRIFYIFPRRERVTQRTVTLNELKGIYLNHEYFESLVYGDEKLIEKIRKIDKKMLLEKYPVK